MLAETKYRCRTTWLYALVGFWAILVGTGMLLLANFVNQPGTCRAAPTEYPGHFTASSDSASALPPASPSQANYRLAMFIHPRCPCSSASIRELARLMASCQGRLTATVYCYRPATEPDQWILGALHDNAVGIPGVIVQSDPAGELARQCGAETSGQVLVYDPDGKLCFQGGITASRGHEGDNRGTAAIRACVQMKVLNHPNQITPVFGCELRSLSEDGT